MKTYFLAAVLTLFSVDLWSQSTAETSAILTPAAAHVRATLPSGPIVIDTGRSTDIEAIASVAASIGARRSTASQVIQCQSRRDCRLVGFSGILSFIGPVRRTGETAEVMVRSGRQFTLGNRNWIAFQDVLVKLQREGGSWKVTGSRVVRES